jgi:DMSO reductase family type II enzyme chaperone
MFVYSLAGLKIQGETLEEIELEDNETTARTGVYQLLARLMAAPREAYEDALAGAWGDRLAEAGKLLAYGISFGAGSLDSSVSAETFEAEFARLFEATHGAGPGAPIYGGAYSADRLGGLGDVVRCYEYFGLSTSTEDSRPADHLSTELEFMKYLTYKEAVSSSPRLRASYRRAQHDFLGRQLNWLPALQARTRGSGALPFWAWAVDATASFVAADAAYVLGLGSS